MSAVLPSPTPVDTASPVSPVSPVSPASPASVPSDAVPSAGVSASPAAGAAVTTVPAADNAAALAHFAARLTFETDAADVAADLAAGAPGLVVIDSRSQESWEQGHIPGSVHLPTALIAAHGDSVVQEGATVVTYCWGPGCNGATRAALEFARLGHPVKEMLGGFEYWAREGHPVETARGVSRRPADELTAPVSGVSCAC